MNTDTGEIRQRLDSEELDGAWKEIDESNLSPRHQTLLKTRGMIKIGRNDPCPCGSHVKFKKCCYTGWKNG